MSTEKPSEQFYRPFEKTGFVPLPQKQKKKLAKLNFPPKKPQLEQIEHEEDPFCVDCYDDCYEDKFSQILLYKIANEFSLRMTAIKSVKVRLQEEYIISQMAKQYKVYICQHGSYHLKLNNKKVLMVRESFRLVAEVHSHFHFDGQLMESIIKTQCPFVSFHSFADFVRQFCLMCPYCRQFATGDPSSIPTPKSRIWFYLQPTRIDYEDDGDENEILTYSRPSTYFPNYISPNIQSIQTVLEQLKQMKKKYVSTIFDPFHCESGTCQHDQYDTQYLMLLFVFKQNRYPLFKTNNTSAGKLIYAIRARIKQFEVRVCNQGTDHLWHRQRNQRVLMKDQINSILQILHNGNVTDAQANSEEGKGFFHRNEKLMRFILEKQIGIYPYNVIAAVGSFLNKCPPCSRKKLWSEYKKEEVYFEENQMAEFRAKLYEARKRFKATKQTPKNLNYEQMLLKSQAAKIQTIKIPTVHNGLIIDPNDSHPNDLQQSPDVRAMLQRYVHHPDLFDFFSNDLIWLVQFNDKKFPHAIADQNIWVRKYAYDGMYRVIMITTQSMRQKYYLYGQCLCVDFIPMMLKRRSPSGRHFQIGFLTGIDSENKLLLFGVCFMSEDLMIYHRKMFQFFFEMVDEIIPGTIITGSGKNLSQAIHIMKKQQPSRFRFNHYISWFYVVEDLKKDLSGEYDRSQMLKQFCSLLVEANPITHEKRLIEITSQIVERTILQKFLKQKNKYCLSCLPAAFMGYAMETKRVQQFYETLTENFIYQSRMAKFMFYIFELERKMNFRRPKIDSFKNLEIVSESFSNELNLNQLDQTNQQFNNLLIQLTELSSVLGQGILKRLMKNVTEAQKIVLLQDEQTIQRGDTFDFFFLDPDHLKYSVRYSTEDECWRCSCPWIYWTGVPCCHIIKMITKMQGNLKYYINQRWIIDKIYSQQEIQQDEYIEKFVHSEQEINGQDMFFTSSRNMMSSTVKRSEYSSYFEEENNMPFDSGYFDNVSMSMRHRMLRN